MKRFADINGSATPDDLWNRILDTDDPERRLAVAVEAATELAAELLALGAPGIHLYTLNQAEAVSRICEQLDLGGPS